MKLHKIRYHYIRVTHRRDYLKIILYAVRPFSALSASSAVNYCVSFSIRTAVFLAGGWAEPGTLNLEPLG